MPGGKPTPEPLLFFDGIRDNRKRGRVADFLREKVRTGSLLRVVSAYFTIYAYDALRQNLDGVDELRFLFGEPGFISSLDSERAEAKAFRIENDELELAKVLQQSEVARRCAAWIRDRVQVRSVRDSGLLHGKLYHVDDRSRDHALVGSSNLTLRGLGLAPKPNIELNLVVDGDRDRADLRRWFDEIWDDSSLVTDVKGEVLDYLGRLYANHSPEFVYLKTLYHLFEGDLAGDAETEQALEKTAITGTGIWQALYPFQRDAAKGLIRKINDFGGCILADSVGLGKTYTALAVIKYFELRNFRVLVLCPKKLCENWEQYLASAANRLNPFAQDGFRYVVLAHTDLSRYHGHSGGVNLAAVNWGGFDLVVVDESHNFRNNAPGRSPKPGEPPRPSRYERLMRDVVKAPGRTRVLMLSATPVNNSLVDLRNQLAFITADDDQALRKSLGIASVQLLVARAQREFSTWAKNGGEHAARELLARLPAPLFKLLDGLSIARSRRHLRSYYAGEIEAYGDFPKRKRPISLTSHIDTEDQFLTYDRLNREIDGYKLSLFNPTKYVKDEYQKDYRGRKVFNFTQGVREQLLIGMMKVNFLKRLESSVHSFKATMENTVEKIGDLERRLKAFLDHKAGEHEVEIDASGTTDEEDEETTEAFEVGKALRFKMEHLRVPEWLDDLRRDREQLKSLADHAARVTPQRDAKLAKLKEILAHKFQRPTRRRDGEVNRKVLVFTAFADTASYLYDQLAPWAREEFGRHCGLVCGVATRNRATLGSKRYQEILTNFAPIAKQRGQSSGEEIDLLIATDCISEGQNLQDCDLLINYDIHWNPVRIIQRFGRIDRLGSPNPTVELVNFWPTNDLNLYINLKSRVEARMALVDLAATADDNLLAGGVEDLIEDELRYRDRQLLRMRDEILDMEDFNDSVSLTDFNLDAFRAELAGFAARRGRELAHAPLGLYAVVEAKPAAPAGAIFCLRQRGDGGTAEAINPLSPHYLLYILSTGEVRFNFTQARQALDLFRGLAAGRDLPDEGLCGWFDRQTASGSDMAAYSRLLAAAVAAVARQFGRRAGAALSQGRDALLPEDGAQPRGQDDFELVTWLVIAPEGSGRSGATA